MQRFHYSCHIIRTFVRFWNINNRKDKYPLIFKTLQFLLMYIRYDYDSNYLRVRDQNDRLILNYLATTSVYSMSMYEE